MKSKKKIIIFLSLVVVAWAFAQVVFYSNPKEKIVLGSGSFFIERAESQEDLRKGLSRVDRLKKEEAMLFVFSKENYWPIWMKDMSFPIDIIWMNKDLIVVDIEKNVFPETYPSSFYPSRPSLYVLEINAGLSDSYLINIGQQAVLKKENKSLFKYFKK